MKQVYVFYVMIFSLLLAVCGCSNASSPNQEDDFFSSQDSGTEQRETDKEPVTPGEKEDNVPLSPETETSVVDPPEDIPPFVNLLELNELRTESNSTARRAEYIEFKVKQTGNLKGISLHIMLDEKKPFIYFFPDINVTSGEYITLHLRTLEAANIDELGSNMSESSGGDSCPTSRDLWEIGDSKWLRRTDIVYLQDAYGRFIDAIVLNENPAKWRDNQLHFVGIIENLFNNGMWKSADGQMPSTFDAVDTSTLSYLDITKSISRYENKENSHTANDWYITANNNISPGLPNK